jgi:hypothetical protein
MDKYDRDTMAVVALRSRITKLIDDSFFYDSFFKENVKSTINNHLMRYLDGVVEARVSVMD